MLQSEYKNIYLQENQHFIYVSMHKTIFKLLHKYLKVKKDLKILDAGCGTGLLAKKLEKFGQVQAVDISPEAVKFAKLRKVNAKIASIAKLPFKDDTFDLITSIDVLYHQKVNDDTEAINELYRVLKPGGLLIIKVPAFEILRRKHDLIVQTRHRYKKEELREKLEDIGFIIQKISYANFTLFPFALIKSILDKLAPNKIGSDVSNTSNTLNKILIKILEFEDIFIVNSSIPFGVSLLVVAKKSGDKIPSRKKSS